ncbi:MAG: hypothetical protein KME31_18175 [Tolypothrix carrinoi HA7290-LM1]|nr:hypothetical protein [Tolypothrix carrinoi HA7290-LM1]
MSILQGIPHTPSLQPHTQERSDVEQGVGGRVWGVGFGWMGILTPTNLYTP